MRVLWLDCGSGASGDMLLGALLDAGASFDAVRACVDAVAAAGAEPVDLSVEPVTRGGLSASQVHVGLPAAPTPRTWRQIRDLLRRAALPDPVRDRSLDVFGRLADAEARVHGTAPDEVHFHEVGALDAIADVVGTSAALASLEVGEVVASTVVLGHGSVETEHGTWPVPAPAVLDLLGGVGAPVEGGDRRYEMCTPTGAALLASVVTRWGGLPEGRVVATGHGAGSRDLPGRPNVLRAVVVQPAAEPAAEPTAGTDAAGSPVLLSTNVDDLDPRLWPDVLARLMEAGAADAWLTPILMKKGRPAYTLSVLVVAAAAPAVRDVVFRETTAIGLREQVVTKRELERDFAEVRVDGLVVRVKVARLDGTVVNVQPEHDDVLAAARATGRPAKLVLADAVAAAAAWLAGTEEPERHRRGMQ